MMVGRGAWLSHRRADLWGSSSDSSSEAVAIDNIASPALEARAECDAEEVLLIPNYFSPWYCRRLNKGLFIARSSDNGKPTHKTSWTSLNVL